MKKFLTLKNIVLCGAALLALIVFFLSFAVQARVTGVNLGNRMLIIFDNSVWGATKGRYYIDGEFAMNMALKGGVYALVLVGFILVLVGAIGAVLVGLLVKKPFAKWIVLCFAVLVLVGGVFQFFGGNAAYTAYAKYAGCTFEQAKNYFESTNAKCNPGPLGIVLAILSILAGAGIGVSALLPEKK